MTVPAVIEPLHAPALNLAVPIEQQIEWLDAVVHDRQKYVKLLRHLMDHAKTNALIKYDSAGRSLMIGAWDDSFAERYSIAHALTQHAKDNGLLIDLMRAVEADGWVTEQRSGNLRALALTIKRYLHMGGVLFLDHDGSLQENGGMPAEWCKRGPNALAIESAFRAWDTIRELPNMEAWAARFVRMAGYRRGNLIILEKRP